jgi:hypothetical protein
MTAPAAQFLRGQTAGMDVTRNHIKQLRQEHTCIILMK